MNCSRDGYKMEAVGKLSPTEWIDWKRGKGRLHICPVCGYQQYEKS